MEKYAVLRGFQAVSHLHFSLQCIPATLKGHGWCWQVFLQSHLVITLLVLENYRE